MTCSVYGCGYHHSCQHLSNCTSSPPSPSQINWKVRGHPRTVGKVEHFWSKLIFAQVKPKKDTDEPIQSQAHATCAWDR